MLLSQNISIPRSSEKSHIMMWTEPEKPNKESPYAHTILNTPIGKIIIEWKSWKESPSYDMQLNNEWIGVSYSLEDAKEAALKYLVDKYNELKQFLNV